VSRLPRRLSQRIIIFCAISVLLFGSSAIARDDSAERHVRELARRVSTELPRNKVNCVNWNNHEAVSDSRSQQWKSQFIEELQGQQNDSATASGSCSVSVYLERTPAQIVVTADVENGTGKQILFAAIPRAGIPAESGSANTLRLEKELLWQQSERILDAIFVRGENGASDRLIVLRHDVLNVYERRPDGWKSVQSKPLGDATPMQRAPRGELYFSTDQPDRVKIVLAGKSCQTNPGDASAPSCQQNSDAWRTGMLLSSPCSSQVWWLRSDGGDMTTPDRLEVVNPSLPATQAPAAELATAGPVLSISSGEALRADTVVVFNLSTGNYEVYRIALACGL
jgi:hypothetical protein